MTNAFIVASKGTAGLLPDAIQVPPHVQNNLRIYYVGHFNRDRGGRLRFHPSLRSMLGRGYFGPHCFLIIAHGPDLKEESERMVMPSIKSQKEGERWEKPE